MSGVRRLDLKYEGDPDLKPICTYEIPFLVRWLYSLSIIINSKVCEKFSCEGGTGDWVVVFVVKLYIFRNLNGCISVHFFPCILRKAKSKISKKK